MVLRNTAALLALRLRDYHPLWCGFPDHLDFSFQIAVRGPYNPAVAETTTVWANPLSLAATQGVTIVFSSSGYLDVSVPRVSLHGLCFQPWITGLQPAGFSHSEIRGSTSICLSPRLIAAYHVLHRLFVPRHPPCALAYLSPHEAASTCDYLSSRRTIALDCSAGTGQAPKSTAPVPDAVLLRLQYVKVRPDANVGLPWRSPYRWTGS